MKTIFSILFSFCFLSLSFGQNQVIKMNPLGFAFGFFNVRYEKALNDKTSFQIGGNFYSRKFDEVKTTGFGLDAEYRFYITNRKKPAPEGFYIGPTIGFDFNKTKDTDTKDGATFSLFGIGATVGYQWIWDSGFALELGMGPQYSILAGKGDGLDDSVDYEGVLPRFGYAF
jgi:hypothetical protein